MGRNLNQMIGELAPERQELIEARYQELKRDVESLREPRQTRQRKSGSAGAKATRRRTHHDVRTGFVK